MKQVAKEIDRADPDLVGLNEVTTWRLGSRTTDFKALLAKELRARRLSYRWVAERPELDFGLATDEGEARFSIGNAILVKRGVRTSGVRSRVFSQQLSAPIATGTVRLTRNYGQVTASVRGNRLRFTNTHLEVFAGEQRDSQATEVAKAAVRSLRTPTLLVGDFNSNPRDPDAKERVTYRNVVKRGLSLRQQRGSTCCYDENLRGGRPDETIDFIFTKPKLRLVKSRIVGGSKIGSGVYPSDHLGVWSTLRFGSRTGR